MSLAVSSLIPVRTKKNNIRKSTARNVCLFVFACVEGTIDLLRDSVLLLEQEQWSNSSSRAGLHSFIEWAVNASITRNFIILC